jgi:hypothetical protein
MSLVEMIRVLAVVAQNTKGVMAVKCAPELPSKQSRRMSHVVRE